MATPGIGDPYFYEWYVGLEYIIKMINPDNNISYVIFQSEKYTTIDDVVVGYHNGIVEECYQVKHKIGSETNKSLTFYDIIKPVDNSSLINSIALGWNEAKNNSSKGIVPVIYTNKQLGVNKTKRKFNGCPYKAYTLGEFIDRIKPIIKKSIENNSTSLVVSDNNLGTQWEEFRGAIKLSDQQTIEFVDSLVVKSIPESLNEKKEYLLQLITDTLDCPETISRNILNTLIASLSKWATTSRKNEQVTIEDVYNELRFESDIDLNQHRLIPPYPFFESRKGFCESIDNRIETCDKPYLFISGNPGSGKTSVISYLQQTYNIFNFRYHTFKPISPEQRFYDYDEGMCTPKNLWGTLLTQIRNELAGKLYEYKVPLINSICSVGDMKTHVLRLLGVLSEECNKKIIVCIDGIDHAARATDKKSFLLTLPKPDEVPKNVIFVLGGQPSSLYKDYYPIWINDGSVVERIDMPNLTQDDISSLIKQHCKTKDNIPNISSVIYSKTQGNNLSVVYAIESIKEIENSNDIIKLLNTQKISDDITEYYDYIWKYAKENVISKIKGISYVEIKIASAILLLNGKIEPRILSNALGPNISVNDITQVFDDLYPLLQKSKGSSEYAIFHNDFRVYLMKIVSTNESVYKDTAFNLANYLHENNEGIVSLANKIQLLVISGHLELLQSFLSPEFIIEYLSNNLSKKRLEEYLTLSYKYSCSAKNIDCLINTYNCIKTIRQHEAYFEYMDYHYVSHDTYDTANIEVYEVEKRILSRDTLPEYSKVLTLCRDLLNNISEYNIQRENNLYTLWFGDLSPYCFVDLFKEEISINSVDKENRYLSSELNSFLREWASFLAYTGKELPEYSLCDNTEINHYLLNFGDEYFSKCIENMNYSLASLAVNNGLVSIHEFCEKSEDIVYAGKIELFRKEIVYLSHQNDYLFAKAISAACLEENISDFPKKIEISVDNVSSRNSLAWVLTSFLNGINTFGKSDKSIINNSFSLVTHTALKEQHQRTLERLLSFSEMLGKYYKSHDEFEPEFYDYLKWILTAKSYRFVDYISAYHFLFFLLFSWRRIDELISYSGVLDDLVYCIFDTNRCPLQIKMIILNHLYESGHADIVSNYYCNIFGKNCEKVLSTEDIHSYIVYMNDLGNKAVPDLMKAVNEATKKEVLHYLGNNEDSTFALYDLFSTISDINPECWKQQGISVFGISKIISSYSGYYHYEIEKQINKCAVNCGINDYYQLTQIDSDFRFSLPLINQFITHEIKTSRTKDDLCTLWLLISGMHSYLSTKDTTSLRFYFHDILNRAKELSLTIDNELNSLTPGWIEILTNQEADIHEYEESIWFSHEESTDYNEVYDSETNESLVAILLQSNPKEHNVYEKAKAILRKLYESGYQLDQVNRESLSTQINSILLSNTWYGAQVEELIELGVIICGDDSYWKIAESLSDLIPEYSYQTITRYLYVLLKQYKPQNTEFIDKLLNNELCLHKLWLEKQGTICNPVDFHYDETVRCELLTISYYILINQLDTNNCRKIEASLLSLYLLNQKYGGLSEYLAEHWHQCSNIQKELLLFTFLRIVKEDVSLSKLNNVILKDYCESSLLVFKYLSYLVLSHISDNTSEIDSNLHTADSNPIEIPPCPDGYIPRIKDYYLSFIESYGFDAKDIIYYLDKSDDKKKDNQERYADVADVFLPSSYEYSRVLYIIEKSGATQKIPLSLKMPKILNVDDPYLVTEMPIIDYGLTQLFDDLEKNDDYNSLCNLINYQIDNSSFFVIGASVIAFNLKDHAKEFRYYTILNKAIMDDIKCPCDVQLSYGIFSNDYFGGESNLSFDSKTIDLLSVVEGKRHLPTNNPRIIPTPAWVQLFGCRPNKNNPYVLEDTSGNRVLWLEKLCCPCRDNTNRRYYKQPLLFRWVCSNEWMISILSNHKLFLQDSFTEQDCEL